MFQGLQEDQLAGALEAMLFVTDEPVGTIALAEMLECEVGAVEAALVRLRDDLEARGSGTSCAKVAGGWRLFTHPALPRAHREVTCCRDYAQAFRGGHGDAGHRGLYPAGDPCRGGLGTRRELR